MGPSIVILTAGEHEELKRSLAVLEGFCRHQGVEILVVSDREDPVAAACCRERSIGFVVRPFDTLEAQRRFGASQVNGEHVLLLDSDEIVDAALFAALSKLAAEGIAPIAIRRSNIVFGKPLKHGGWYPDPQIRLYRREDFVKRGSAQAVASCVAGDMQHYSHETWFEWYDKGVRAARARSRIGRLPMRDALSDCRRRLFAQNGAKDGWVGVATIAYLAVFASTVNLMWLARRCSRAYP